MWGGFDVDRDRPAGLNHGAQPLPRLGLVDDVGDRHAGQSSGCIFELGCTVEHRRQTSFRALRPFAVWGIERPWGVYLPGNGSPSLLSDPSDPFSRNILTLLMYLWVGYPLHPTHGSDHAALDPTQSRPRSDERWFRSDPWVGSNVIIRPSGKYLFYF